MSTLQGTAGDDSLTGTSGNDVIYGYGGDDTLLGGDGRDTIDTGSGVDFVDGGAGRDSIYVHDQGTVLGGGGGDSIFAWAYSGELLLDGGKGDDRIEAFVDHASTLLGGSGDDQLTLGVIHLGELSIEGGAGHDTMLLDFAASEVGLDLRFKAQAGGSLSTDGRVSFTGVEAGEIHLSQGDDRVSLDHGNLLLDGYLGNDVLMGGPGDNVLLGDAGDDVLKGGAGDDTLVGGDGKDRLVGGEGYDVVSYEDGGGVHVDLEVSGRQQTGGGGKDVLIGIEGIIGSTLSDVLAGDDQSNLLRGNGGDAETIDGRGGDDTIVNDCYGNGGVLTGGAGADDFVFLMGGFKSFDHFEITDLQAEDVIDLSGIDADITQAGDQSFTFVEALSGQAGSAALVYDAAAEITHLQLDTDGDLEPNIDIVLDGDQTGHANFIL